MVSAVLGSVLIAVGAIAIMAGVAISVVTAFVKRPSGFGAGDALKILEAVKGILDGFVKLDSAGRLMFIGGVCEGVGIWLLVARPV